MRLRRGQLISLKLSESLNAQNKTWFKTLFNQTLALYPDVPAIGSPYDPLDTSPSDRLFGPASQFKREASIYGDLFFESRECHMFSDPVSMTHMTLNS